MKNVKEMDTKTFLITILLLHLPLIFPIVNYAQKLINNFSWINLFGIITYCLIFFIALPQNLYDTVKEYINEKVKEGKLKNNLLTYIYLHIYTIFVTSFAFVLATSIFQLLSGNFLQQLKFYGIITLVTLPIVLYKETRDQL